MKNKLKVFLFFAFIFCITIFTIAQASIDSTYSLLKDKAGVTAADSLEQSQRVNYKLDFAGCGAFIYYTDNASITKDGNYYVYTFPNEDITGIAGTLTVLCPDAAVNWEGTRYDLRIIVSNMVVNGYVKRNGKDKKMKIFGELDKVPWIEAYGSFWDALNDVNYDITMQIVDKEGVVQSGTFVFAAKDIDIKDKAGNYGDLSEGITLKSGVDLSTLRVKTNSTLCYKDFGGSFRITGTTDNDYTDRSTSQGTGEEAGFSIIADASGTVFNWTGGRNCGTALCDFGQPEVTDLITFTENNESSVIIRYKDIETGEEIHEPGSCKPGDTVEPLDISDYEYVRREDPSPKEIIFWYKYIPHVTVKYILLTSEDLTKDNFISSSNINLISPKKLLLNQERTLYSTQIAEAYHGEDCIYIGGMVDGQSPTKETQYTFPVATDRNDHTMVFGYVLKLHIRVIRAYSEDGKTNWTCASELDEYYTDILPVDKTFVRPEWNGMIPIDGVTILPKTQAYLNEGPQNSNCKTAKLSVVYMIQPEWTDEQYNMYMGYEKYNEKYNDKYNNKYISGGIDIRTGKPINMSRFYSYSDILRQKELMQQEMNKMNDIYGKIFKGTGYGNNIIGNRNKTTQYNTIVNSNGIASLNADYGYVKPGIVVVFYYMPKYKMTIEHYNETFQKRIGKPEIRTVSLIPDITQPKIPSKSSKGNLNVKVELDGQTSVPGYLQVNGFEPYSWVKYNVVVTPDNKSDHALKFTYKTQKITVEHRYENGKLIKPPEEIYLTDEYLNAGSTITKLDKIIYLGYKLNGGELNTTSPATFTPQPLKQREDQKIVYIYKEPGTIIDPSDPNGTAAKLGCGVSINTMNNQLIGQNTQEKYWVLDEKGTLTIKYANDDMGNLKVGGTKAKITFPFDVVINGELKVGGTEYTYDLVEGTPITKTIGTGDHAVEYKIYTSTINVHIPVWSKEGAFTTGENRIKVSVYQNFNITTYNETTKGTESEIKEKSDSTKVEVNVVGAVYDFSVTNIDGSNTTGDQMWKTSLFTNPILAAAKKSNGIVEYETNILPIGQVNQQNAKYSYGIKKGTKFYFSVNTKGAKNTAIEITPKFYYFDKAGNIGNNGNPIIVRSGNTDITSLTRTTTLTDANRGTAEYQKELAQGRTTYGANTYSNAKPTIFANKLITIGTGLRTPFVNYGKDPTSSKYHEISATGDMNKIYKGANHWYADYVIPNNATFYDSNNKQLPADGFVVVAFSIRTKAGNEPYLAYSLYSPFTTTKQSEWAYEGAPANYTLSKTLALTSGKAVTPWLRNVVNDVKNPSAYAPVIIYQFSAGNPGTQQNVDSTGTH